jgi:hypothetical protein
LRHGYGTDPGESRTAKVGGHHGILIADLAQDNLVRTFSIDLRFVHDLGVSAMAAGTVFVGGGGVDLSVDHHRRAPFENLFCDLQAGEGSRLWESGGDETDGPHGGARETFWNIRTRIPQEIPPRAIEMNLVGISTRLATQTPSEGNWLESIPPERLRPSRLKR